MYVSISADLIYSRPRLTSKNKELLVVEENVQIKPACRELHFFIPNEVLIALKPKLSAFSDLFNINRLGTIVAATYMYAVKSETDGLNDYVRSKITDDSCYFSYEDDFWRRSEAIALWNEQFNEHTNDWGISLNRDECFVDGYCDGNYKIESFEDFITNYEYTYGEVIDEWLEDIFGRKILEDSQAYKEFGFYRHGKWYKEHFRFKGFTNITKITVGSTHKALDKDLPFDELISLSKNESLNEPFYSEINVDYVEPEDIGYYKNWHRGRLEYFQNSINERGLSSPHLRTKSRDIYHKIMGYYDYICRYQTMNRLSSLLSKVISSRLMRLVLLFGVFFTIGSCATFVVITTYRIIFQHEHSQRFRESLSQKFHSNGF